MGSTRRWFGPLLAFSLVIGVASVPPARAQDDTDAPVKHGRKYKAPPETAHIEVMVVKGFNKKPIMNAAVIFHPIDASGKDEGTLEVKSGPDGKAFIDVIAIGSEVRLQVLADGFATYAQDFKIDTASRSILVSMLRPQAQISAYTDDEGKPAQIQPGIQEPIRPRKATTNSSAPAAGSNSSNSSGSSNSSQSSGSDSSSPSSTKPQQ